MQEILDSDFAGEQPGAFEFYRDFFNMEQVDDFIKILYEHGVPFKLEKNQTILDSAIVGHGLVPPAVIKIRPADFKKVNAILEKSALANPHFIADHYLHDLDARELLDILKRPDEWTVEDAAVARKILEDRGIAIPVEEAAIFKKERNELLRQGKRGNFTWMSLYIICVLLGGILFSPLFLVAGVGMGWYYWQDKTIDTEGRKFFTFEPQTRLYGKVIFYLGWISLAVGILVQYKLSN
ncbi:MAG: hypothetical protein H6577_14075 [Lewinellaceae bacterium]|nr:hypothetical protein [Saprospiraceae bacterium]MCB9339255.1 hypothetical protein [Lewinellaceae bacterium]